MVNKKKCNKIIESYKIPKTTTFRGKKYDYDSQYTWFGDANNRIKELKKSGHKAIIVKVKDHYLGGYKPIIYVKR